MHWQANANTPLSVTPLFNLLKEKFGKPVLGYVRRTLAGQGFSNHMCKDSCISGDMSCCMNKEQDVINIFLIGGVLCLLFPLLLFLIFLLSCSSPSSSSFTATTIVVVVAAAVSFFLSFSLSFFLVSILVLITFSYLLFLFGCFCSAFRLLF